MASSKFDKPSIKTVFLRFLIFGVPLGILSFWGLTLLQKIQMTSLVNEIERQQEELVLLEQFRYENLFSNMYDDLNVIAGSDDLNSLSDPSHSFQPP